MSIHLDPEKVRHGAVPSNCQGRPRVGAVLYVYHVPGRLTVRLSTLVRNEAAAGLLRSELLSMAALTDLANAVSEALVKAMLEQWLGRSATMLIGLLV